MFRGGVTIPPNSIWCWRLAISRLLDPSDGGEHCELFGGGALRFRHALQIKVAEMERFLMMIVASSIPQPRGS
jgi:hypothetical protein